MRQGEPWRLVGEIVNVSFFLLTYHKIKKKSYFYSRK